ncbi:unnamed protein product, partial [marine sediment metagenome]
ERHRKDMGDLAGLVDSIRELGMLHPIVVTATHKLIAGLRRLEACKRLGWERVPVRIIELRDLLRAEHDENMLRKEFEPTEAVAIKRAIEEREQAAAKRRQGTRTDKHPAKLAGSEKGRAREKVADAVGMGHESLRKAEEVVEAAEAEPEEYGDLQEQMDVTGKVDPAYQELKRRKEEEAQGTSKGPGSSRSEYATDRILKRMAITEEAVTGIIRRHGLSRQSCNKLLRATRSLRSVILNQRKKHDGKKAHES